MNDGTPGKKFQIVTADGTADNDDDDVFLPSGADDGDANCAPGSMAVAASSPLPRSILRRRDRKPSFKANSVRRKRLPSQKGLLPNSAVWMKKKK